MANFSGSCYSGVRDRRVYEAGNQRTTANSTLKEMNRIYNGNILQGQDRNPTPGEYTEVAGFSEGSLPTGHPHGNEQSREAKIDTELQGDDQAILTKKGDTMPGKKN
ncbi:hypothetical protein BR93DRAFT_967661 [Coniochaeta sp. PMI_546]|nr:hypothetical protein BR93DRAFT_967661 [Coniochaeta sp. PMI_546]